MRGDEVGAYEEGAFEMRPVEVGVFEVRLTGRSSRPMEPEMPASRRLTRYQVHAHDAATGHYLACDWRLTVYERILLARARELRYQSAQEDFFACELGGLKHDIGNFG